MKIVTTVQCMESCKKKNTEGGCLSSRSAHFAYATDLESLLPYYYSTMWSKFGTCCAKIQQQDDRSISAKKNVCDCGETLKSHPFTRSLEHILFLYNGKLKLHPILLSLILFYRATSSEKKWFSNTPSFVLL